MPTVPTPETSHAVSAGARGALEDRRSRGSRSAIANIDALVLDARLRQSLVTVRSLGRRGLSVAALETNAGALAFASRWCAEDWVSPSDEGSDAYGDYLEQLLERTRAQVVIPSSDGTVELLRRRRRDIERHARIAMAAEPALSIAVDKRRTLDEAKRLGVATPRQVLARSIDDVPAALAEIGLPAVVKPCVSWQHRGSQSGRLACALVTSHTEAARVVSALTRFGGATLVQEYLTGRRHAISFLYADGRVYARFAQTAKRTSPPIGGESVLRQSVALPAGLTDQAEALVRAIGIEGYSEVEFRCDAAGVPRLMEINPRLSASVEIAVRSGVDFPLLLHQWASGRRIDRVPAYRTGLWMRYLGGDIMTTYAAFRERGRPDVVGRTRAVLAFALTFLHPMAYDGFDWSDLGPTISATRAFARGVGRGLWRVARSHS